MADRRRGWPNRSRRNTGVSGHPADAQRLQDEKRQECADPVERDRRDEDGHPAPRGGPEDVPQRDEQRRRALRRVQQTVVCRGELPAKEVATHGGEQAVDLTPGEEDQTREHDEQARDVRKGDEERDRKSTRLNSSHGYI